MTLPNINYSQNESINDLGLGMLRIIKENPGINAPSITSLLSEKDHSTIWLSLDIRFKNPSEKRNPFSLMIRTERAICIKGTEAISKK